MPDDCVNDFRNINAGTVGDRLAAIHRLEHCQLMAVALDQLGQTDQHRLSFSRMQPRPRATVKCFACLLDSHIHICLIRHLDGRENGPVSRVGGHEGITPAAMIPAIYIGGIRYLQFGCNAAIIIKTKQF